MFFKSENGVLHTQVDPYSVTYSTQTRGIQGTRRKGASGGAGAWGGAAARAGRSDRRAGVPRATSGIGRVLLMSPIRMGPPKRLPLKARKTTRARRRLDTFWDALSRNTPGRL